MPICSSPLSASMIPARETAAFISAHVKPGAHIIEVGCGDGDVASLLARRGFCVCGVERDVQAVTRARARGIQVFSGTWPSVVLPPADAVCFTRSLHHVAALTPALVVARAHLHWGGVVLIEDFAFKDTSAATVRWLVDVAREAVAARLLVARDDRFLSRLLRARDPVAEWRNNHEHELHSAPAMARAAAAHFAFATHSDAPYLYRYLADAIDSSEEAGHFVEDVLAREMTDGAAHRIELIGRRIVARNHFMDGAQ